MNYLNQIDQYLIQMISKKKCLFSKKKDKKI